ncbi:hypothetical protein K431DRAFT_98189 [Polychaeton citri CBS 116435]|uniref:N-acetylgalactosaminide beta-1,3-galactosyltransferase n=1 Tax=Polychaeton citri CBS 116435 TaxID=1314669 RepID=A0A9P4UR15_9PEZI|nr:hypothetical protein K431DRAFT_98189 [Polychaeton citri CBS 116435]
MTGGGVLGGRGALSKRVVVFLLTLFVIAIVFRTTWLPLHESPASPSPYNPIPHETINEHVDEHEVHEVKNPCQGLPGADKVLILLKTGVSEIYQKLPVHLLTTFQCIPNYMVYSDLEQNFTSVTVHDALAPVTAGTRDQVAEFRLYDSIKQWAHDGQDLTKLPSGWDIDKFKFLPMLHHAFDNAPTSIEWFVMIEPDTSMSWLNLLLWLQKMNPKDSLYMGSQNNLGETKFAHGGSGIIISRGAADKLNAARANEVGGREKYDQRWEQVTSNICCGDVIVAKAFAEVDVEMTPSWPLTQGESLNTIDWTYKHWCTPAVTWHHVTGEQVDELWHYQEKWAELHGWNKPYLFRDLFAHFIDEHISVNRSHWNNLSNDRKFDRDDANFQNLQQHERDAVQSAEACAAACMHVAEDECIQWMWTSGKCHLGRDLRYGTSDEPQSTHWTSGWPVERVSRFKKAQEGCETRWRGS